MSETVVVHSPPPELTEGAAMMFAVAQNYRIDCPELREAAGEDLKRVKTLARDLEERRKDITRPLDLAKARVMDLFRKPAQFLADAERLLKRECLRYDDEQDRKRREEEAAAARAADEERRRLEAEAKAAAAAGQVETAHAIEQAAQFVAPVPVAHEPLKVAGESKRETWHAEVEDLLALAKAVAAGEVAPDNLLPNMPVLNAQAKALKRNLAIPGVKAVCERVLATRAA